jgi:hypothetical protein
LATKVLTIALISPTSFTWVADDDYTLVGCFSSSGTANALVTTDPQLTVALALTPSVNSQTWDTLWTYNATTRQNGIPFKIPITKGREYVIKNSVAATNVMLYLDPAESAE